MKFMRRESGSVYLLLAGLALVACVRTVASQIQIVSGPVSNQLTPAGGNGDSCAPVLNADSRFVVFASTANNLVPSSNNIPLASLTPARFNAYLRDRVSQQTTLISPNTNGTAGGNGDSFPVVISTNGRFVLFESSASDLVANDTNNATDIFLRDCTAGITTLVSVATNGSSGNGASHSGVMTPDGRYVAFVSEAFNLSGGDTNKIPDVFFRDLQSHETTCVSARATSTNAGDALPGGGSDSPELSADGRFVAFSSTATNLVPGVVSTGDIFVYDRLNGTNRWASAGMRAVLEAAMGSTNGHCYNLALSVDGKVVVYQASVSSFGSVRSGIVLRFGLETGNTEVIHTNSPVWLFNAEDTRNLDLTPDGRFIAYSANSNGVTGTTTCIHVWDAVTGTSTLVSGDLSGAVVTGSVSSRPVIDATGRYVSFLSSSTGMVLSAVSGKWHVYQRDLLLGTTTLVDAGTNGSNGLVTEVTVPSQSVDGRFVAYESADTTLTIGDNNRRLDIFVRDVITGTNEFVSACHPALDSRTPNGLSMAMFSSSADGRYVAYTSEADSFLDWDTNGNWDVFVRDLAGNTTTLVSAGLGGATGNGVAREPTISGDGRLVAFTSDSTNLVVGDTNKCSDVFLRNLQTGALTLVSRNAANTGTGNNHSYQPTLSSDGRWLIYRSMATDLDAGPFGNSFGYYENVFQFDTQFGTNFALSRYGCNVATITPSGRYVSFEGSFDGVFKRLYVRDTQAGAYIYTNLFGSKTYSTSPDGRFFAYLRFQFLLLDRVTETVWTIANSVTPDGQSTARFSADGRLMTYTRTDGMWSQIFVYDTSTHVESLISHSDDSSSPGNGNSDQPDISPDGRFIAYHTYATNLLVGVNGYSRQLILHDQLTGRNRLLSANRLTGLPVSEPCARPRFTADGQTLLFQSWSSDLTTGDFNRSGDLFAHAILTAVILPTTANEGPWLYWPFVPGNDYHVEFKNSLNDPTWQTLPGNSTTIGVKAWQQDITPNISNRFYRISIN